MLEHQFNRNGVRTVRGDGRVTCRMEDGRSVSAGMLLFAAGRLGHTDTLNIDAAGLTVDARGRVAVEPKTLRTAVPHISAVGDVIGFPSLDLDGAGPHRRLPRLRAGAPA